MTSQSARVSFSNLVRSFLQEQVEDRKACYQETIARRKYLHAALKRPPTPEHLEGLNYPTECDLLRYQDPSPNPCASYALSEEPFPPLSEDKDGAALFFGLARLELARRFPHRAGQIFGWETAGLSKSAYWDQVLKQILDELPLFHNNADFGLNILIRLLYLYGELPVGMQASWLEESRFVEQYGRRRAAIDPNFDSAAQEKAKQVLLGFKYWPEDDYRAKDEPKLHEARVGKQEGKGVLGVLEAVGGGVGGGLAGAVAGGGAGLALGAYAGASLLAPKDPYAGAKYEMEYWSENHQILFSTAEYLVGQLWPEDTFFPGQRYRSRPENAYQNIKGKQRMERAAERVHRWLDDRLRFGQSEVNGPGYYDEHIVALLNLADFSLDETIHKKACLALDLLLFDLARLTHAGSFSAAAARSHFKHRNNGWGQSPGDLIAILFGSRNTFTQHDSLSACAFASSRRYDLPEVILRIGLDRPAHLIDRTRVSINFNEAHEYGIGFDNDADILRWWSRASWFTKDVIDGTRRLVEKYGLEYSDPFQQVLPALEAAAKGVTGAKLLGYVAAGSLAPLAIPLLGNPFGQSDEVADAASIITEGSAYTRANIYTYRNQDVMLSSMQNHHSGQLSFQTLSCQATLSMCATVFTSHPSAGGGIDDSLMKAIGGTAGGAAGLVTGGLLGPILGGPAGFLGALGGAIGGAQKGAEILGKDVHFLPPNNDGPDWWTGSITQPRVLQVKNAAILAYKPKAFQLMLFGSRFHAWFPQDAFDNLPPGQKGAYPEGEETRRQRAEKYFPFQTSLNCNVDTGRWVFGRVGNGYIGLFSGQKPEWTTNGDWACHEIMVSAQRNIFIIQVGNQDEFGSYEQFVDRVRRARIHINGLNWKLSDFQCSYDIPGGSRLSLAYDDDETAYAGLPYADNDFPRIENQYTQVKWLQNKYVIQHDGHSLTHNIKRLERKIGGLLNELEHEVDLKIYGQNMGLFGWPLYKGAEREKALQKLIKILREGQYDLVGLSELWQASDRDAIREALGDLYSYWLEGPDEAGSLRIAAGAAGALGAAAAGGAVLGPLGTVGGAIIGAVAGSQAPNNGGLFLLSRHKITQADVTVFRQCLGEDCLAYKGALHARIHVEGLPCELDIFLSHTQNLSPVVGKHSEAEKTLKAQLRHLAAFIQACRDDRSPALLMGDLNVDAIGDPEFESYLHTTLGMDEDLRPTFKPPAGLRVVHPLGTSEDENLKISSFPDDNSKRAIEATAPDDPSLLQRFGPKVERLDYFLSYHGALFRPVYTQRDVVVYQSSEGRDLSDHYGIQVRLASIRQKLPLASQPIKSVQVRLTRFWCLQTTSGPGDDEVEFSLMGVTSDGKQPSITTRRYEDVNAGDQEAIQAPALQFGDPGDFLILAVRGKEIDDLSANDDLGTGSSWLMRSELQALVGTTTRRVLPRLTGEGGEYALEVEITVG